MLTFSFVPTPQLSLLATCTFAPAAAWESSLIVVFLLFVFVLLIIIAAARAALGKPFPAFLILRVVLLGVLASALLLLVFLSPLVVFVLLIITAARAALGKPFPVFLILRLVFFRFLLLAARIAFLIALRGLLFLRFLLQGASLGIVFLLVLPCGGLCDLVQDWLGVYSIPDAVIAMSAAIPIPHASPITATVAIPVTAVAAVLLITTATTLTLILQFWNPRMRFSFRLLSPPFMLA